MAHTIGTEIYGIILAGTVYAGKSVSYDEVWDHEEDCDPLDAIEFINKPDWATHVFWSSK